MKKFLKKIFKKINNNNLDSSAKIMRVEDIKQTTNAVFEEYKKSFKDLARYDRGEKISAN